VRFSILGPLNVSADDGTPIMIGQQRRRSVLAALLLHANRPLSSDALMKMVWGGDEWQLKPGNLRTQVYALRKLNGMANRISHADHGYLVTALPGELDAEEFLSLTTTGIMAAGKRQFSAAAETLAMALKLWRDPMLADIPDSPQLIRVRENLETRRVEALGALCESSLSMGRNSAAIDLAYELVAVSPWHERGYELLMLALYRSGRRTEALEAFTRIRALLVEDHGIEPQRRLRRLHLQMLADDPPLIVSDGSARYSPCY
jgi:DNA-binding SARP family transcriptional activator